MGAQRFFREHDLPNGGLAVSHHWAHGTRDAVTVPADDRPLYRLLRDVLTDASIPDTMPARLAVECDNLVEVREAVTNPERGNAIIGGVGYGLGYLHEVREAVDDHRDRDPMTLVAVGCSGSKHEDEGTMPARDRYARSYWTCKQRYFETFCDDGGRIISAEHGLLHPDTPIEYYERTPDDLRGVPVDSDDRLPNGDEVTTLLDRWAVDVFDGLQQWLLDAAGGLDPRDVELEVLLGTDYRDPLEDRGVFDALSAPGEITILFPFQEAEQAQGGNGNQMGWMTDEVDAATATDGGEPCAE